MADSMQERAQRLAAEAPPFTDTQIARLSMLLGPALRATMAAPAVPLRKRESPADQSTERAASTTTIPGPLRTPARRPVAADARYPHGDSGGPAAGAPDPASAATNVPLPTVDQR